MTHDDAKADEWTMRHPRAIYFLNQANLAARTRLDAALAPQKLTAIQYTVLSVIGSREGLSSAELSRRFFVTPQTMNEVIGGLQHRNLILRKEDPTNRRILRMRLTAEGRRTLQACDNLADKVEREVFGFLSAEDYERFRDLSRVIARELRMRDEESRQVEVKQVKAAR